ncbi:Glu/Leu/Phe/Val dehydrogenase dimerization domain-containing protein [Crossiella sp. CA-258035]|uniref:Glu/Leu/Phe/Val dehydrogenase dimerization domain-containing protein n=1 Tax=Crossiella sp. CA-258035 TaxID=2981138 RepID=UPI0024BC9742|nr:Glu/Leu/Phe/Val dehydrogenase dimerization domain-containing protein [Crossiella sp. CA-258035]WHT15870.1 Glu/Leu/Phe/Val dehydrogenase dimerization domain-containing protein [Crossiella sp. CA-258035]
MIEVIQQPAAPAREQAGDDRAPLLELTWTDPVTGKRGFLVIDRLVRGVCSGGLRLREGCTLSEVRGLARGMTAKEALNYDPAARYLPLGGAKGGIDCSPYDPASRQVLRRYLQAVRPYLETVWTTGEDLGLRQDTLDEVIAEVGLSSSIQAVYPLLDDEPTATQRLIDAFAITVDGIALDELVGGAGVAQAALTAMAELETPREGARAVIQGFGSMGGATARFLAEAGLRVVGIADIHGTIANPNGLDVERLLHTRDPHGAIDRTQLHPTDEQLPRDAWLTLPTEVLVPAAISYCVNTANHTRVTARLIVEAANLPITPEAETALTARGVTVIPDIVANSATNSWWWWALFGDINPNAPDSFTKVRTQMHHLVTQILHRSRTTGVPPRAAATAMTTENLAAIEARFG